MGRNKRLERIAHTEVKSHILPLEVMDPTLAHRLIGAMQLHTPVKTQNHKLDINTQTQTRIHTELLIEAI